MNAAEDLNHQRLVVTLSHRLSRVLFVGILEDFWRLLATITSTGKLGDIWDKIFSAPI